jgi:diaminopimelate epimerase
VRLRIQKVHGSGNDFPLVDARGMPAVDWPAVARLLADRAGPVGGDGLLLLDGGGDGAEFAMRMFNPDGSESESCLNGLRCVARAGFEAMGIERATARLKVSRAAVERAAPLAPGVYTVTERVGPVDLDVTRWPMTDAGERIVDAPIPALSDRLRFTAVAMPNPHLVAFVDAIDEAELVRVGLLCEAAPAWLPNRANVSFARVRPGGLFVRTHERGVGLTNACGSAMAASTVAAGLTGRVPFGTEITVWNPGGLVRARADADLQVTLSGNATVEWEGAVTVDLDAGTAGELVVERRREDEIAAWEGAVAAAGR